MSEPMQEAYATMSGSAKIGGAETGTVISVSGHVSPLQAAITDFFRARYPRKTWAFLADLLQVGERVAKHRLSNTRSYTIEELQVMLQSDDGLEILQRLMADAEPAWWWWAKRVMAIAARRRAAAEIDQEILQLETSPAATMVARRRLKDDRHAANNIGAKLARAETAIGFLAPDSGRAVRGAMAAPPAKAKIPAAGMRSSGRR